jgi:phosphatidylinositol glycan class M
MHWYWIYLARARTDAAMALTGQLLLLPQLVLLVYTSLGVAPSNLPLALFLQTFLFVAHNKVITAQYFTWYLCLLPLCSHAFCLTRRVVLSLVGLLTSVVFWLASAYCLEMQGMAVHRVVWVASCLFFCANINLLSALLQSSKTKQD